MSPSHPSRRTRVLSAALGLVVSLVLVVPLGTDPAVAREIAARQSMIVSTATSVGVDSVVPGPDGSLIARMAIPSELTTAQLAAFDSRLQAANASPETITDDVLRAIEEQPIEGMSAPEELATYEFEATMVRIGPEVQITVPAAYVPEAHTTASRAYRNFWLTAVAWLTGRALQVICTALAPETAGLAGPLCGFIGGFFITFFINIFTASRDDTVDMDRLWWANTTLQSIAVGLMSAIPASLITRAEGALRTFLRESLPGYMRTVRTWGGNIAVTLRGWFPGVARSIEEVDIELGHIIEDPNSFGENFADGVRRSFERIAEESGLWPRTTVMPMGDSITWGFGDPDGNGYRNHLQESLGSRSVSVSFLGTQTNGSMADPENEGYPGRTIAEIDNLTGGRVASMRPHVVTLMAGTNDMIRNVDVGNALNRLQTLIDQIIAENFSTVVVVATLTPSRDPVVQARITTYNAQIRSAMTARAANGQRIVLVDMANVSTTGWPDNIHPGDAAYEQMGRIFSNGIAAAVARNWIPGANLTGSDESTAPTPGPTDPQVDRPDGSLADIDPADYELHRFARWQYLGVHAEGTGDASRVRFLDFDGDGDDDYGVFDSTGALTVWRNNGGDVAGGGRWADLGVVAAGTGDVGRVRFLDFDGDGDDDWGVLGPAGELNMFRNNGGIGRGGWEPLGRVAAGGLAPANEIRFMDADGDGDDDYVVLGARGEVDLWRNDGGDIPGGRGWVNLGRNAQGNLGERAAIRFMDIDGDRDDDYIVLGTQGAMLAWRNDGGDRPGGNGWHNLGLVAEGTGDGSLVHFAHMDPDTDADYVVMTSTGRLTVWNNQAATAGEAGTGTGGGEAGTGGATGVEPDWASLALTGQMRWQGLGTFAAGTGDGSRVRFLDIDGDRDSDYGVLAPDGELRVWRNNGGNPAGGDVAGGNGWTDLGVVARGAGAAESVRFIDYDTDRRADYAVLGPNGELTVWRNNGGDSPLNHTEDGANGWEPLGMLFPGRVGPVSDVRFLDFDGDGDDDYAILGTRGELYVWLNHNGGFHGLGMVARGTSAGNRVQFMDADGDRDDDYIVLGTRGEMLLYLNNGGDVYGGGGYRYMGKVADGTGDGSQVRFIRADNDRCPSSTCLREDYATVDAAGRVRVWLNNFDVPRE